MWATRQPAAYILTEPLQTLSQPASASFPFRSSFFLPFSLSYLSISLSLPPVLGDRGSIVPKLPSRWWGRDSNLSLACGKAAHNPHELFHQPLLSPSTEKIEVLTVRPWRGARAGLHAPKPLDSLASLNSLAQGSCYPMPPPRWAQQGISSQACQGCPPSTRSPQGSRAEEALGVGATLSPRSLFPTSLTAYLAFAHRGARAWTPTFL